MRIRMLKLMTASAFATAMFTGCGQDAPTAVRTVRLALLSDAEHGGVPFATPMTQEVTSVPPYEGDPDGHGFAVITINLGQREVCWQTSVSSITLPASASHIHNAPAGVRGGIVIPLSPPGTGGTASGCAGDLSRELLSDILQHPANYYVNVHTTDFPSGAIRGQLGR